MRLAIPAEGETEEEFVNKSLAPHLQRSDVYATPVLVGRGRDGVPEAVETLTSTGSRGRCGT